MTEVTNFLCLIGNGFNEDLFHKLPLKKFGKHKDQAPWEVNQWTFTSALPEVALPGGEPFQPPKDSFTPINEVRANLANYDRVVIPAGEFAQNNFDAEQLKDVLQHFVSNNKPIFCYGNGAWLLANSAVYEASTAPTLPVDVIGDKTYNSQGAHNVKFGAGSTGQAQPWSPSVTSDPITVVTTLTDSDSLAALVGKMVEPHIQP